MRRVLITLGAFFLLLACDGPGAVGDECQRGAADNDCVEGAVCTLARSESFTPPEDPNNERFYCRTICETESDCEDGFDCRQAAGTMMSSCQPSDEGMSSPDAGM